MKRLITIVSLLALFSSCGPKNSSITALAELEKMPSDPYKLSVRKDINLNWRGPSTIDLKEIKDGVTWIYAPALTDCFGYDDKPGYLKILSEDKIVAAKLCVSYFPTIWSNESDNVIQLIEYSMLSYIGIKDISIDEGKILLLNDKDLFTLPDNVLKQAASISKDELLTSLDELGPEYEYENWAAEKKIWTRYISHYKPGDFVDNEKEDNRFGVYPKSFMCSYK